MHDRVFNPHYHSYHRVGGRGITISPRWAHTNPKGFEHFVSDMGEHPGNGYVLGRMDTNRNYTVHNTLWLTRQQHANHQRHPLGSTGLRGVRRSRNKYRADIWRAGKCQLLGIFTTARAASKAYQRARAAIETIR
jgi:hypothetical protein